MNEKLLVPIVFITNVDPCQLRVKSLSSLENSEIHDYRYNYMICLLREDDDYGRPLNYRCSYSIENNETSEVISSNAEVFTPQDKRDIIKFIHAPQKLFKRTGHNVLRFDPKPETQEHIYNQVKLWKEAKKT
jgi:hypothetical protein